VPDIALIDTLRYNKSNSFYGNIPHIAEDDKEGKHGAGILGGAVIGFGCTQIDCR
jgi:hypothetical protein